MNIRSLAGFAALAAGSAAAALAQDVPGGEGPDTGSPFGDGPRATLVVPAKRARVVARRVTLPALDVAPLLADDDLWASVPGSKRDPRVAVVRRFHPLRAPKRIAAGVEGVEEDADGSLVWSAEIEAPGAVGLRLSVARCELPPGASLVVYDADDPREAYGPIGARAERFLLPTVFASTVRVEIKVPAAAAGQPVRFEVDRAAQRYRERAEGLEDPRVGSGPKATSSCNNNVACDASYVADVARAVATMEITTSQGVFLCTGSLLNDSVTTTTVPYFLTAHHCLSRDSEARDTEFYFDYRAATCEGSPPPLSSVPRVSGATLLATSAFSDFTLLRLTGTLPSSRYFCGWTAARQAPGTSIAGVHHPGGTHMRISYGALLDPDGDFLRVRWTSGVTAGGSSGSPLFNTAKQVIGQLYGGASSCSFQSGVDEYGRFDRTYPSISQYLGAGGDANLTDGFDTGDDTPAGATLLVPRLIGDEHGPHTLSSSDAIDWFAFDLGAGHRYRFFSTGSDDVRASVYSDQLGTELVASDEDAGGSLQFSIDFEPATDGRYLLAVERQGGAVAAEYDLRYIEVDERRTASPPRVAKLRATTGLSTVTLHWKDRSRTEAGYYVDLSDDHGASWSRVAELPPDANAFAHEPGAGTHLYRVGAWNAAATVNYRSVSVTVRDAYQTDSFDPLDDTSSGAVLLSPATGGITSARTLSRVDDEDWYRISLTAGRAYEFASSGPSDVYAELFADAAGFSELAVDDDSGKKANFRITYVANRSDTFWLRVTAAEEGDPAEYTIRWTER